VLLFVVFMIGVGMYDMFGEVLVCGVVSVVMKLFVYVDL